MLLSQLAANLGIKTAASQSSSIMDSLPIPLSMQQILDQIRFNQCLVGQASRWTRNVGKISPTASGRRAAGAADRKKVKSKKARPDTPDDEIVVTEDGSPSPPSHASEDDEPQMSTPDDPVIHSPPSIGGQLMNGYNPALGQTKMEEMGGTSPEGSSLDPNGDGDARRRQKTCRVCGDHATGYNFNVITCESCKAFFRRNALRPKEFKCPYAEDCDINAVSRRFCQKCRLRKCFTVGMKKEWILNEEQLRRRKNSRLNSMSTQGRQKANISSLSYDFSRPPPSVKSLSSPLSISPMEAQVGGGFSSLLDATQLQSYQLGALNRSQMVQPLVSPPSVGYSMMSPAGSVNSDSPPTRPLGMLSVGSVGSAGSVGQRSPEAYESNLMFQQRQRTQQMQPVRPIVTPGKISHDRSQVILSMDEYQNLMHLAATRQSQGTSPTSGGIPSDDEPPAKRSVYSPSDLSSPQPRTPFSVGSPLMQLNHLRSAAAPGQTFTVLDAVSSGDITKPSFNGGLDDMFFDNAIKDALNIDSPEMNNVPRNALEAGGFMKTELDPTDTRLNYQLNAHELRELDVVTDAFKGMNDPMEPGRQKSSFLKEEKSPADIINIMDVTMRRLVKVAKKLSAFNELSQDGKFALLKGGMVEMLTVRGVTRFDSSLGAFRTPTLSEDSSVNLSFFDKLNAEVSQRQKLRFMEFFKIFHEDIRNNDLAINIVMLIVLFSPRENLAEEKDRKILARYYDQYTSLLNRYLESLYGDDAKKIYEQIPKALSLLKEIAMGCGMLFFGTVNTADAEALPREFFKVE